MSDPSLLQKKPTIYFIAFAFLHSFAVFDLLLWKGNPNDALQVSGLTATTVIILSILAAFGVDKLTTSLITPKT